MSTSQEAPALIQYACERCKTRFVLPPSSRQLTIAGKFRAFSMGVGRTFRHHEGLGAGYDTARRQLLAKMDDEAYQSFVQSFRFCHECRQFVCNECWSTSRRSCLTCVAKSMSGTIRPRPPFAPTGPEIPRPVVPAALPRKGRMRRDVALVALAIGIILASIEGGYLLVEATSGPNATPQIVYATMPPSASPTESPSAVPTESPSAVPTESPSAVPTEIPIASASATVAPTRTPTLPPGATPRPTPIPTPTPTPTPTPPPTPAPTPSPGPDRPAINCSDTGGATYTVNCWITSGSYLGTDVLQWALDGSISPDGSTATTAYWDGQTGSDTFVQLTVTRPSFDPVRSNMMEGPSPWHSL